ncbi:MAG: dipeptide/oligopeptide/nickel ABC transporter ATP-binding protein [Planctomycetes bacterium]|nr:dipeptide/oligopeptide/nickel ABC transporter ATP-binding protein [Planctomycetota bacterium]
MTSRDPILEVAGLAKTYRASGVAVAALDDVSFELERGERLAVVGESGSGKSTLLRALLRLVDVERGRVKFAPRGAGGRLDWLALSGGELARSRRFVQGVFQDPKASLNPRRLVRSAIEEPWLVHRLCRDDEIATRASELAARVGLDPATTARFPHELSLGQLQRACIARALASEPELLLLDEPTSALDVGLQAQIVNLILELARERNTTLLFVSHDLDLVRYFAERVIVLERGRVVERRRSTKSSARRAMRTHARSFARGPCDQAVIRRALRRSARASARTSRSTARAAPRSRGSRDRASPRETAACARRARSTP